jgi:hypothetical protein
MWASGQGRCVRGVVLRHLELEGRFGAVLTWDPVEEMTKNYHISVKGVGLLPLLVFVTHKYQFCGSAATDCPDLLVLVF